MGARNLHHFGQGRHKYCLIEDFEAFEITAEEAQEIVDLHDGNKPSYIFQSGETWYEIPDQEMASDNIKESLRERLSLAGFETFADPPYDTGSLHSYPGVVVGERSFEVDVAGASTFTGNAEVILTNGYHEGASVNVRVQSHNGDFTVDEKYGTVSVSAPKKFRYENDLEIHGAALNSLVRSVQKRLQKMVDDVLDDADAAVHPICDGFKGDYYAFQTKDGVSKVGKNSRSERELAWHYREFVLSDPTLDRKVRSQINNMDHKKLLAAARKKGFTVVSRNEYFEYEIN
jgi:hypothetical protein